MKITFALLLLFTAPYSHANTFIGAYVLSQPHTHCDQYVKIEASVVDHAIIFLNQRFYLPASCKVVPRSYWSPLGFDVVNQWSKTCVEKITDHQIELSEITSGMFVIGSRTEYYQITKTTYGITVKYSHSQSGSKRSGTCEYIKR